MSQVIQFVKYEKCEKEKGKCLMQNGIESLSGPPRAGFPLLPAQQRRTPRIQTGMASPPAGGLFTPMPRAANTENGSMSQPARPVACESTAR